MLTKNIIVTTSVKTSDELIEVAKNHALNLELDFNYRNKKTIKELLSSFDGLVVIYKNKISYFEDNSELFFHLDTTALKLKNNDNEPLTELIPQSSSVLDCTMGLASDSILLSYYGNKVTALEKNRIIHYIVSDGLRNYIASDNKILSAMRSITTHNIDCLEYLKKCEDKSFDIIYFDPMFSHNIKESMNLSGIEPLADYNFPTKVFLEEARRVAKNKIIVKAHFRDNIFEKYKKFIEILLNSKININKEKQKVIIVEKDREVSSQKKLDADIELEKNLGNLYLYYLSNSLKDDFRMISPNKKENELPKGNDYIITLTRIIEDFLTNLDYEKIKYSNIGEAIQNIEDFYGEKLSDSLRCTNSNRYINELEGEKSSLGAKVIVFLSSLKGDYESLLENLIKENFIELIEELIKLRGHRNNIENNLLDIEKINLLRDRLFKSLKLIGGYCYGEE